MELTKVQEIINYTGRVYFIRPYVEEGRIKRNNVYTAIKKSNTTFNWGRSLCLGRLGDLDSWGTRIHTLEDGEVVDENTIANCRTGHYPLRFFTDRESAKKALEEYVAQNTYNLSESIDKELKYLENEKKKINEKIKVLKERKKECFSRLTTSFTKKS